MQAAARGPSCMDTGNGVVWPPDTRARKNRSQTGRHHDGSVFTPVFPCGHGWPAGWGLARPVPLAAAAPSPTPRKVIVDADIGVDDTMALLLVHFAPEVEIIGITTVNGNGTLANTTRNALFLAEKFRHTGPRGQRGRDFARQPH
ncbi:nucleoside hydrolase [Komagataeibacter rhaeticus]|nr:nucleoside hydrolase [Komagataeibacter rhaeticus]